MPKQATFLSKTFALLSESPHARWALPHESASFVLTNPAAFATEVLPRHFKHSNLNSFVRQLNAYGFHKVSNGPTMEFHHPQFLAGHPELLDQIQPKKAGAGRAVGAVSDDAEYYLAAENERLTRELERSEASRQDLQAYITQLLTIIAVNNGNAGADVNDGNKRKRAALSAPPPPPPTCLTPKRTYVTPGSPRSPMSVASPCSDSSYEAYSPLSSISTPTQSPMDIPCVEVLPSFAPQFVDLLPKEDALPLPDGAWADFFAQPTPDAGEEFLW
jgi:hypothetical protein